MMRSKFLSVLGMLPIWKTKQSIGYRKKDGYPFVVTWKEVWLFGWIKLVVDVRMLDES